MLHYHLDAWQDTQVNREVEGEHLHHLTCVKSQYKHEVRSFHWCFNMSPTNSLKPPPPHLLHLPNLPFQGYIWTKSGSRKEKVYLKVRDNMYANVWCGVRSPSSPGWGFINQYVLITNDNDKHWSRNAVMQHVYSDRSIWIQVLGSFATWLQRNNVEWAQYIWQMMQI